MEERGEKSEGGNRTQSSLTKPGLELKRSLFSRQLQRLARNVNRVAIKPAFALRSFFGRSSGIQPQRGELEVVVSLTTTPQRLANVHLAVESLLHQTFKPQRIILWISDKLGPADLTKTLTRQEQRGLEVRFRQDVGPHTKLLHALREHPGSLIVTADDDTFYPATWLADLHQSYQRAPNMIHCHRAHWITHSPEGLLKPYREWNPQAPGIVGPAMRLLPTGVGGVLYPPGSLHHEVFNESCFLSICPTADDIWFKAMSLLNKVPCIKVAPFFRDYHTIKETRETSLHNYNSAQGRYDAQIRTVFEHYDLRRYLE